MNRLLKHRKRLPVLWAGVAAGILALDYATGPEIAFPFFFLIPVSLAARFNGRGWGVVFAVLLPLARPCFHFFWDSSWDWLNVLSNAVIRILVLTLAAILVDLITRQAQEIRVLKGVLPVCSFCKKIRTPNQQWEQMEAYISRHSEALFSHTLCPTCAEKYYKEFDAAPVENPKPQAN